MTNQFRIVRRAFSQYSEVELFTGSWCDASNRADALQFANKDGEYFIRNIGEAYHRPSSSYQSGLDWL